MKKEINKNRIWYKDFNVYKDDKNNIIKFEANMGSDIHDVIKDIKKYLNKTKNDNEYIINFNEVAVRISRYTNVRVAIKEYNENYTLDKHLFNL